MAKEPEDSKKVLRDEKRIKNIILDNQGNEVFNIEFIQQEYEDEDNNTDYTITEARHVETSNGNVISANQLSQPESRGGVTLRRCDGCEDETKTFFNWLYRRDQRQITFAPAKSIKQCALCRHNFCERHYIISKDRRIRCKSCDRKFRRSQQIKSATRLIFMRKV